MIVPSKYKGRTIGVFGLARTGLAAFHSLKAAGAHVYAFDDDRTRLLAVADAAYDFQARGLEGFDGLVLAPGVPTLGEKAHPLVGRARDTGVPLLSDFDLFEAARSEFAPHIVITVTGTNGKSTTTALIAHIAECAGMFVQVGGNIGTALLELDPPEPGSVFVIEASSFQLELTRNFNTDVGILLNITPDHLDRHLDMPTYQAVKKRLFDLQKGGQAVLNLDDEYCREIGEKLNSARYISAVSVPDGGVGVKSGTLIDDTKGKQGIVGPLKDIGCLVGEHNYQNIAAAYSACQIAGIAGADIYNAILSFPGLEHRQELVGVIDGVRYINDSKATNMEAASRALKSFDNILWIMGGRPKDGKLGPVLRALGDIKAVYLNGEASMLLKDGLPPHIPTKIEETLEQSVRSAIKDACVGDTVLLSPGCTAFDQFDNFEVRGSFFRDLVLDLTKIRKEHQS